MDGNKYMITFAERADEPDLQKLLGEHELAMCGEIEDYTVLKIGEKVCAAGRLVPVGRNSFHLEVFGVKSELQGRGAGGYLLSEIIKKPWKYSSSSGEECSEYRVTTVARGEAAGFYKKYGFQPCNFAVLPPPYDKQCDECEDREGCKPLPMVYEKKGR